MGKALCRLRKQCNERLAADSLEGLGDSFRLVTDEMRIEDGGDLFYRTAEDTRAVKLQFSTHPLFPTDPRVRRSG